MKLFTKKTAVLQTGVFSIPRFAFVWLLASIVAVIIPHIMRMPLWLTAVCACCILLRILIYQGRMSFPGSKTKTVIVVVIVFLVLAQFGRNVFSTDATVGVLLTGITLKLLEMRGRRDVLLVLYLCYFTAIAEFIYSQSIPIAIYMFFAVTLITSAMLSLNQSQENQHAWRTFKFSLVVLLQSAPLMLVLFVVFPRISPFWSVPLRSETQTTGLSDTMSPGDISELTRSAEVAFRVKFQDQIPLYNQLYWRALTLADFDGRSWRQSRYSATQFLGASSQDTQGWYQQIQWLGNRYEYNIIMEPTFQNWIYTLQMPVIGDERMVMRSDYQVQAIRQVTQRLSYDVSSSLQYRTAQSLPATGSERSLMLPADTNPDTLAFARELRANTGSAQDYANAVLRHFNEQEFYYTLSPRALGSNPVDQFLFQTREGFCEHFASAFTVLMRAANIPARVVTGYMGGEFNPYDGTLTVRQYDAHAWAEVWLEDQGWVRYDPTAMVAPNRVDQGSDAALQEEPAFLENDAFTLIRFRNMPLLNELRYRLEMLDYAWNRFVLNYDQDMQFRFFNSLFGTLTLVKMLLLFAAVMSVFAMLALYIVLKHAPRSARSPAVRLYLRFCHLLAKRGFTRKTGETPEQYMHRVAAANPQWRMQLEVITAAYVELAYQLSGTDEDKLAKLKRQIRDFRQGNL